jgi:glycosyltransferase involved in cell wall biosynthesis
MKIFAISVIKNEADVIQYNLQQAALWAEKIFVLDNGSTDGTWEKVLAAAAANDKIVPWKQEFKPFYEGLRGEVFNAFRHEAQEGDWWCYRLDADEFYIDDPREFLPTIAPGHHFVNTQTFEYQLTRQDLEQHQFVGNATVELPLIRHYHKHTYAEARFFRHRNRLQWEPGLDRPRYIGIVSPKRIRVRHYQYRSPEQMQRRADTRIKARQDGFVGWDHAARPDWRDYLCNNDELYEDKGDGRWQTLGNSNAYTHKWYVKLIKTVMHGVGIWP